MANILAFKDTLPKSTVDTAFGEVQRAKASADYASSKGCDPGALPWARLQSLRPIFDLLARNEVVLPSALAPALRSLIQDVEAFNGSDLAYLSPRDSRGAGSSHARLIKDWHDLMKTAQQTLDMVSERAVCLNRYSVHWISACEAQLQLGFMYLGEASRVVDELRSEISALHLRATEAEHEPMPQLQNSMESAVLSVHELIVAKLQEIQASQPFGLNEKNRFAARMSDYQEQLQKQCCEILKVVCEFEAAILSFLRTASSFESWADQSDLREALGDLEASCAEGVFDKEPADDCGDAVVKRSGLRISHVCRDGQKRVSFRDYATECPSTACSSEDLEGVARMLQEIENECDARRGRAGSCPEFMCPIRLEVMKDPVIASDGHTYEMEAINRWLSSGHVISPVTGGALLHRNLTRNHALRKLIEASVK